MVWDTNWFAEIKQFSFLNYHFIKIHNLKADLKICPEILLSKLIEEGAHFWYLIAFAIPFTCKITYILKIG